MSKNKHPEIAFMTLWPTAEEVAALPAKITKIIASDPGVVLPDGDWLDRVAAMLDETPICQPFSRVTFLREDGSRHSCMASASAGWSAGDRVRWGWSSAYYQQGVWAFCRDKYRKIGTEKFPTLKAHITAPLPKPKPAPDPESLYADEIKDLPEQPARDESEPLYVDEVRILTEPETEPTNHETSTSDPFPSAD